MNYMRSNIILVPCEYSLRTVLESGSVWLIVYVCALLFYFERYS